TLAKLFRPTSRRKAHAPVLLHSFAFLPYRWFCKLSGEERPWGSLPAFASGDVATHIPSITVGHSLFPRSCARTAMGRPRSLLSRRERYGVSTFRLWKYVGLGACSGPGGTWVTKA